MPERSSPNDRSSVGAERSAALFPVSHRVESRERERRHGHSGAVLWLTGLSAVGKSTLAVELERCLWDKGYDVYLLDGDNVRVGLNAGLGFTPEDRAENIRRIGEVAALLAEAGLLVVTAFISPYRADRERARAAVEKVHASFHEIYVTAPLATCEARDPKGLYAKARAGQIPDFTGISAPYEPPTAPDLVVDTGSDGIEDSVALALRYVIQQLPLTKPGMSPRL